MAKRKKRRKNRCKTPGRRIRSKGRGKGLARGKGRGPIGRPTRRVRRKSNPTSLARTIVGKVAQPGARFSLTALKEGLRKLGYRNVKGWFDEMVRDAIRRRVITPVSKSIYVYTPAAANPCPFLRAARKRKSR